MIMLFEDKESSGISKMLKYAYSRFPNSGVVEFAGGNRNLINRIKELDDGTTTMFVYVDVMPDNVETVSVFNDVTGSTITVTVTFTYFQYLVSSST